MTALEMLKDINDNNLENIIRTAAQEYYSGEPTITDIQFDSLVERLREVNPDSEVINTTGWGYETVSTKKAKHKYGLHIGSLSKIHDVKDVPYDKDDIIMTPKLDGLSVVVYVEDGNIQAITRGNGSEGIDITDKIKKIADFSRIDEDIVIRGEIIVTNEKWELVKAKYPDAKNPRNFASGVINRNEVTDDIKFLDVIFYNVLHVDGTGYGITGQQYLVTYLNTTVNSNRLMYSCNLDELNEFYEICKMKYPIDGIVISYRGIEVLEGKVRLDQIAFKFPAESKDCVVNDIEWNMTRTGNFIPVVKIDTVELSGTNVSRVTGFNAKYILDNEIGVGSVINVCKANEIIPDIQYVVKKSDCCKIPDICPVCGSKLEWSGVNIKCFNPECSNKEYEDLKTFVNIIGQTDNIGWTVISKFFDELNIKSIDDLFKYGYNPIDENNQAYRKLFNVVLKKIFIDKISIVRALQALNIPRLGKVSAEKLGASRELIELVLAEINNDGFISKSDFEIAKYVGNETAKSIKNNSDKFNNLLRIYDRIEYPIISEDSDLIEVCITGKLSVKRSVFEEEVRKFGFISRGISKNTKYLITDDPDGSSSKNKKANEWGIEKISEKDFREKFMN